MAKVATSVAAQAYAYSQKGTGNRYGSTKECAAAVDGSIHATAAAAQTKSAGADVRIEDFG